MNFLLDFLMIYIPYGLVPALMCMTDGSSSNTPTIDKSCPSDLKSGSNTTSGGKSYPSIRPISDTPIGNKANTTSSSNNISGSTNNRAAPDIGTRKSYPTLVGLEKINKQSLHETIMNEKRIE